MNQYPLWRYVVIVVLVTLGIVYALPNVYGEDYAIQLSKKVSFSSTNQSVTTDQEKKTIQKALAQAGIPFISIHASSKRNFLIRFKQAQEQLKAQDVLSEAVGKRYSVALNLAPRTPLWLRSVGASPMKLGLDLRGGIHFLLYVNLPAMLQERFKQDVHSIGQDLREASLRYTGISQVKGKDILISFANQDAQQKAEKMIATKMPDYVITPGVGVHTLSLAFSQKALTQLEQYAVEQNITTLRTKVNELGVAEPVIQQQGKDHISVDLPGIQDTARAKAMIGTVATVRLQLVDTENDAQQAAMTGIIPAGDTLYYMKPSQDNSPGKGVPYLLKNDVVLTGQSITNASSIIDQNGRPAVSVSTSGSEVPRFYQKTAENIGKPMAVVYVETKTKNVKIDGKVKRISYPVASLINVATIQTALSDFQITGLGSQEAKDLSLQLRSGAYTAPVVYVQERLVGPSLGKANIQRGVLSCEMGSLVVILFMALYYRLFGLVANVALILNVVFVVAVMSILGATMTLPGIAGIVLTVGMAVDANVLINERIREELRLGMSPLAAIRAGYERAFSTIVDANVTTLIVAVVLYSLGTGSVQGFAVTLTIGLLTSMLTAIFFTRGIVNLVYGPHRKIKRLSIGIRVVNQV